MEAVARVEGVLLEDPAPYSISTFDGDEETEEVATQFWMWHQPKFKSGFDGAVSKMVRTIVAGELGQDVLQNLHREDHIKVEGVLHFKRITSVPSKRKGGRARRLRYSQHTLYLECNDDEGVIDHLGRMSLADAGIVLHDDWETQSLLYDDDRP